MAACATTLNDTESRTIIPLYNETAPYPDSIALSESRFEESHRERVISALEKKGFYWRAVDSIARETGLQEIQIKSIIKSLIKEGIVIRAPRTDAHGRILYTTRKHYRETRGFLTKLVSALANQIV